MSALLAAEERRDDRDRDRRVDDMRNIPQRFTSNAVLVIAERARDRRIIRRALSAISPSVLEATTGAEGVVMAATARPKIVILALGLPDLTGHEVCTEIRRSSDIPLLVLSAQRTEAQQVELLDAGADDCIALPFSPREFQARVQVQLRHVAAMRTRNDLPPVITEHIRINFAEWTVSNDGSMVRLTSLEWKLLRALALGAGQTLTHRQIFDAVWERTYGDPKTYLRVYITKLRKKVEPVPSEPVLVLTDMRVGYRMAFPHNGADSPWRPDGARE